MNNFYFFLSLLSYWIRGKNPIQEMFLKEHIVLDIGCGEGKILEKNMERGYGIDINTTMVRKLQKDGFHVKEGNVTNIPYEDNFFDVVHCSNIIEHLTPDDAQTMFREMKRVLKPGGEIILITPMPKTVWNTFGHVKPYPPMAIKKLFREVSLEAFDSIRGLKIKNIFYYGTWASNRITFFISTLFANTAPSLYAGSYLMVVKKDEEQ